MEFWNVNDTLMCFNMVSFVSVIMEKSCVHQDNAQSMGPLIASTANTVAPNEIKVHSGRCLYIKFGQ